MVGNVIQIALDGSFLWILTIGMFREKIVKRDWWLFPIFTILCGVARISVEAGTKGLYYGFHEEGFEIIPVRFVEEFIILFLMVLVINSLWFLEENRVTLFGTCFVFGLFILFRQAFLSLLYIMGVEGDVWFVYIGRILPLLCGIFFRCTWLFGWVKEKLKEGNVFAGILCSNTIIFLVLGLYVMEFSLANMLSKIQIVIMLLGGIVIVDALVVLVEQKGQQERKRIRMLEQYLPVIEELITEVKANQHQYKNRLLAISGMLKEADTLEQAEEKLEQMILGEKAREEDLFSLLNCDSKIISGLLYSKIKQAEMKHIKVCIAINASIKQSRVTETDWGDILGILLDNGIEASQSQDAIWVRIQQEEKGISLQVSNPHSPLAAAEFVAMFRRGFTTKKNTTGDRGYGLANVRKMVEGYQGKIITKNEIIDHKDYLTIGVLL